MIPLAQFDPPDSHWADDFDRRLMSSFHWLKDRIDSDESEFATALAEIRVLVAEAQQYVRDARYWAEKGDR